MRLIKKPSALAIAIYAGGCAAAALVVANANAGAMLRNDPNRPVAAISADLGVTPDQFVACFWNVNPAEKGTAPTGDRQRTNKAILLPCLQQANPSITNASLDAVMDKYRPQ